MTTLALLTQALNILDIVFGVVGLLLLIRILLHLFRSTSLAGVTRAINAVTDPILTLSDRLLGIPSYGRTYTTYTNVRSDVLRSAGALVVLWTVRTLLVWIVQLVISIPGWLVAPLAGLGGFLFHLLALLFDLYTLALFVRIIFEWVQMPYSSRVMRFLYRITEPLLAPIRQLLPPLYGFDLSPLIAFFLLRLLRNLVFTLLSWIF